MPCSLNSYTYFLLQKKESWCKKTQMGIGHSGNEGFGKACYIRSIGYMDNSGKFKDVKAQSLNLFATRPFCYNVEISNIKHGSFGTHIYFGGPA